MARKSINVATAFLGVTPTQRVEQLRTALAEERRAARDTSADSWDTHVARRNAEHLEEALERAEHNAALHAERVAGLRQAEAAKTAARQEEEHAALEAELRRKYDLAMPKPVTDAEWEAVRESVLHRHRLKQMDAFEQQVAEARRKSVYRI